MLAKFRGCEAMEGLMHGRNGPRARCIDLTSSGLAALVRGDLRAATASWIDAADLPREEAREEPCPEALSAAIKNNAGVAHLINGHSSEALASLAQAQRHWTNALRALRTKALQAPGANSVFHLQLAIKHHDTYAQLRHDRSARACKTGRAITALNRSMVLAPAALSPQRRAAISVAVSDTLGPRCAELEVISDRETATPSPDRVPALSQRKLDSIQYFAARQSAASGDDVELAVRLAVLIHPTLRFALAPQGHHPHVEKD